MGMRRAKPAGDAMFARLLSQHILQSTRKQFAFRRRYPGKRWHFEKSSGRLTLDGTSRVSAEIIGTYSLHSGAWLWSWANDIAGIPEELTVASRTLRDFGVAHRIAELSEPKRQSDEEFNHELIGLVAIGLLEMPCFFHAAHADGSVLLMITDKIVNQLPAMSGLEFVNHVLDLTNRAPVADQRLAVSSFGRALGWTVSVQDDTMTIVPGPLLQPITAIFDAHDRLVSISVTVPPRT